MESIGETIWYLAFLVQYGALIVASVLVVALLGTSLYELIRNRVRKGRIPTEAAAQESADASVTLSL